MNDETKGRRAQEILDDQVFQEAQQLAKRSIKDQWVGARSQAEREALWHQFHALTETEKALRVLAGRGQFAVHERQRQEKVNA